MNINLVEEWKLYETMWDTSKQAETPAQDEPKLTEKNNSVDPVQQILNETPDIEFNFNGFDRERYEDKWSDTIGHYTNDWVDSYGEFTYKENAATVFEDIRDEMVPRYIDKVKQIPIVAECKKLYDEWTNSTDETEEEACNKFELFVAKNLEVLAEVFEEWLIDKYSETAMEWAEEHKEPIDPSDYWEDLSKNEQPLEETVKVMSNPDNLYHWTNPTPFVKIFTENCLRADVNMKCVCFTTDKDYMLYEYPCGLKLSREKLLKAGYELEEVDEFDWDPDGIGESEERIYKNIDNITDYVTAVGINWEHISVVQSKDGDRIADATYDEYGDELENYDLFLNNFYKLLDSLKAKGIKVVEKGKPQVDEYYLDDNGKLNYGKMPA